MKIRQLSSPNEGTSGTQGVRNGRRACGCDPAQHHHPGAHRSGSECRASAMCQLCPGAVRDAVGGLLLQRTMQVKSDPQHEREAVMRENLGRTWNTGVMHCEQGV